MVRWPARRGGDEASTGGPPQARVWLIHAFPANSVYQFPTTAALLDALRSHPSLRQLCGWESVGHIPSESTFRPVGREWGGASATGIS